MDETNQQIYFLNKIISLQQGKDTVIFLAAMNDALLGEYVNKPGYQENIKKIGVYFADKPVAYINFNGKIDYGYFSDHVHLTPRGYQYLSDRLWTVMTRWSMD